MVGGRTFFNSIRNICGSKRCMSGFQKTWFIPNIRDLSYKVYSSNEKYGHTKTDLNIIKRRFLHHLKNTDNISKERTLPSTILGLIGAVFAVGIGTSYLEAGKNILKAFSTAHCEGEEAPAEPCIEKKCEESACLRIRDCEENLIRKANNDIVRVLKDVKGKAITYTESAMKAYCEAIETMKEYMDQSYCLMDYDELEGSEYEEAWCCVYKLAKKRCAKVKDAIQKGQCAWELLGRLRDVIDAGKACKYTACHPLLVTAEESLICAERELLNLKARMDCAGSCHKMVEDYKGVIKCFREELRCGIDFETVVDECGKTCEIPTPEEELPLIFEQAYIRVVRAQRELAQIKICSGEFSEEDDEEEEETEC